MLVTEMGCAGSARSPSSARSRGRGVVVVTAIGPEHLELVGTRRATSPRRTPRRSPRCRPAGPPSCRRTRRELEPYLERDDIEIRRFDGRTTSTCDGTATRPRVAFTRRRAEIDARAAVRAASPRREHARGPRRLRRARAAARRAHEGAARIGSRRWRGEELAAARRRDRRQRRLQREPGLDAGRARSISPSAPARRRRVAILGEMAELGDGSTRYHREIGALLAELGIDRSSPSASRRALLSRRRRMHWLADAASFARPPACSGPGDAVLVKASRAVGLEGIPTGSRRSQRHGPSPDRRPRSRWSSPS